MNINDYNLEIFKIIENKIFNWIEEHKKDNDCKLSELDSGDIITLTSDIAIQFYALNDLEIIFNNFLKECNNKNIISPQVIREGNNIKIELKDGIGLNDRIS